MKDPADFKATTRLPMPDSTHYVWDEATRNTVRMAWAAGRPLLAVGDPGCGKTQLAQALASAWTVPLLRYTVHARTQAQDLMFQIDAVARLADAQVYTKPQGSDDGKLDLEHYVSPGILWWAWNRKEADKLIKSLPTHRKRHAPQDPYQRHEGATTGVVLIDEIDKAPQDVPEALLDVLDTGAFDVPWGAGRIEPPSTNREAAQPFVVLTSNASRGLPAPLLRRCVVLELGFPKEDAKTWLVDRAKAHFKASECPVPVMERAADIIISDRDKAAKEDATYLPATAEYIDLLRAVVRIASGEDEAQRKLLDQFAPAVTTRKRSASVT